MMDIAQVQLLLAQATYYAGAIDGDAGPKTWAAVEIIERTSAKRYQRSPRRWSRKRRLIGAGQAILDALGYEPGLVDGYAGHNTDNALAAWLSEKTHGKPDTVARKPIPDAPSSGTTYPRQRYMRSFYGVPGGRQCTAGKADLPYSMRLSWNKRRKVNRISCHELLAVPVANVFRETLAHYGEAEIKRLGLDLYGGCYNNRSVRGGRTKSTHAWGAAIDIDPDRNRLRWGSDRAEFAKPEYEPFMRIMVANGATPAGYAWGADWMHFQWARL